jgi:hypothetical protein
VDRLAYKPGSDGTSAVFIIGLPRSGTTLVYELVAMAFKVAYLTRVYSYSYGLPCLTTRFVSQFAHAHLPRYESNYGRISGRYAPAENHVLWEKWLRADEVLGHFVPSESIGEAQADSARKMLASMTAIAGRTYIFKDVYLSLSPAALLQLFPGARLVLVTRDTNAVCESIYRARSAIGADQWWSVRPPFFREQIGNDVSQQTAFQCARTKQLMKRETSRLPRDRVLIVSYEDVCESPRHFLEKLQSWAGLERRGIAESSIPAQFHARGSGNLPAEVGKSLAEACESFDGDAADYLNRVDRHVSRIRALAA